MRQRVASLNQRICQSAKDRKFNIVQPQADWFGLDPIHVRRRFFDVAWTTMMQPLFVGESITAKRSLGRWLAVYGLKAERYRRFGAPHTIQQPSRRLSDATSIALY